MSVYSSKDNSEREAHYSLEELERLAVTAGSEVLEKVLQQRDFPDRTTYVGKGKAHEIADLVSSLGADTVITNQTLAPSTRRALEDVVDAKVIDRTALILDIFAQHAKSRSGMMQVELAQLEYLLPRLRGWGEMMSRQAGGQVAAGAGMGSRGPGETQLEIDRRRIRTKISQLKVKIKKLRQQQSQARQQRLASTIPSVAIVGYTNSGKSSLLNSLTDADIIIQDALFATLDTTTRQMHNPKYTITDTVGFIQDLPTALVEAFRATLSEAADADILLHIVDCGAPNVSAQIQTVNDILQETRSFDEGHKITPKDPENELLVFNKIDLLNDDELLILQSKYPNALFISVKSNIGVTELLEVLAEKVKAVDRYQTIDEIIPYSQYSRLNHIYKVGEVLSKEELDEGVHVVARVPFTQSTDKAGAL